MPGSDVRFLFSFFGTTAVLLALLAGVNLVVDPFGAHPELSSDVFRNAREIGDTRTAKAELVRHFPGHTVLIGSSRVRKGYDPQSPLFEDGPACNLGLGGTNFTEMAHALQFTLQQPQVRRIILCLDFQGFNESRTSNYDFESSRFNPELSPVDYQAVLTLSAQTTFSTVETVLRKAHGELPESTPLGFHTAGVASSRLPPARLAYGTVLKSLEDADRLAGYRYSAERIELLADLTRQCRRQNVELIVLIQPTHAIMQETIAVAGLWEVMEDWERDVVTAVHEASAGQTPVWDYTCYTPYTTEPLLTSTAANVSENAWFYEPSHCKPGLGEQVLLRIFGKPGADPGFGSRLTPENIEGHLAELRLGRTVWSLQFAEEQQIVEQIGAEFGYKPRPVVLVGGERRATR
jgi:hypothetical protein